jgi:hypothetical protein
MKETDRVAYGITVDGSQGPPFRMKTGGVIIAKACRAPLFAVRTWYARYFQLPTWDGTAIPLPFNRIHQWAVGPYWIAPDCSKEELEEVCRHLELELYDLTYLSIRIFRAHPHAGGPRGFPRGWKRRWKPGQVGVPRTPHDLRPDDPPPWAPVRTPEGIVLP